MRNTSLFKTIKPTSTTENTLALKIQNRQKSKKEKEKKKQNAKMKQQTRQDKTISNKKKKRY